MYNDMLISGVTLVVCAVGTAVVAHGFWELVKWVFKTVFAIDIAKELKGDEK